MSVETINIEILLAAIIDDADGVLTIPAEVLQKDRSGKAISINYEAAEDWLVLTLVDSDDIDYEE